MAFTFNVEYISGAQNVVSDCLSRLPSGLPAAQGDDSSSIMYISSLSQSLNDIRSATAEDDTLSAVISFVESEWPKDKTVSDDIRPYYIVRESFSSQDGVVYRGERIVVPQSLQKKLINLAHEFHFGLTKTKSRLQLTYWWPKMDSEVEAVIRACHCCKIQVRESPVQITEWPVRPWTHLAIDIAGPKTDVNGKSFYTPRQ